MATFCTHPIKPTLIKGLLVAFLFAFVSSCTKYTNANDVTNNNNNNNGQAPTPLPPFGGGGTGSGGTGSGSGGTGSGGTGSGGTGSGGTGTGGGQVNPNVPLSYVQALFFTNLNQQYVNINDSVSLKFDGSYTNLYAGVNNFRFKQGPGNASDRVFTANSYFLRPYSYYSYTLYPTSSAQVNETLIANDITAPAVGKTNIRFISLDPFTSSVPVTCRLENGLGTQSFANRTYLDHRSDTSKMNFTNLNAAIYNVSFVYRDSSILKFSYTFESAKSYTIFAGALGYTANTMGTFPVSYYQVARHN
ncbi:MAG: hypothetical protein ACOVMI_09170 [Chitinophagaceae bacterium]